MTLKDITEIAGALSLSTRAVRCELGELRLLNRPSILHWGLNHFVVLERADARRLTIIDPAVGRRRVTLDEASKAFSGVALEVVAAPSFEKRRERSPLKLSTLFRWTPQMAGGLVQALLLSLLVQAYVIASPFYMQLSIDEVALKGDRDLLVVLAAGFALFCVFNAIAEALRGVALQYVSALLSWDMSRRLYHHMVRLPLPWFQRRRLADALTRFESLNPVKTLIANGLVGALIDGLLSIATLVMMTIFAPVLALAAILGLMVYVLIRISTIPLSMRVGMAALSASIDEQGKRIETLRAIQTIKVMAAESERESDWGNKLSETVRTGQTSAFLNLGIQTMQRLVDGLVLIGIIFLGISAILDGTMTIGVLYAFLAYRTQFTTRMQGLVEQIVQWRLLDLHTHRLADIALHPVEAGLDRPVLEDAPLQGRIELRNVGFAYAPHEPPVLRNLSLLVRPGEFLAIVGPSGTGKSTLLKVLCGLYPVSSGDIFIDGRSLSTWSPRALRRNLGVVMQDDELLSGSIAENVSFFDEKTDMDRVWEALRTAMIADDVMAMPMRTQTLVGDMGSALSGGQKQRLILARALYRKPSLLVLDEATSHLDLQRERAILDALEGLSITRLIVAHRPETIQSAHRVLHLPSGTITAGKGATLSDGPEKQS